MATQVQRVDKFFSRFSETWDTLYGGRRTFLWRQFDAMFRRDIYERYELTLRALGDRLDGKSVLDIGCGSGIYCHEVARRGASHIVGVDVSMGMVALAEAKSHELGLDGICKFVCSDFPPTKAGVLEGKFDYGIVMGVMDYIEDPTPFLKTLKSRIKDFAVISFPVRDRFRYPIRKYRYQLLGRCKVFHFTRAEMETYCRAAGFRQLDVQCLDYSGGCFVTKVSV